MTTKRTAKSPSSRPSKQTSSRVSRIAGKVLRGCRADAIEKPIGRCPIGARLSTPDGWYVLGYGTDNVTVAELRALAASCLTQDETPAARKGK